MWHADYYTLIIVLCATAILGSTAGSVGAFALLRKQSLLGDAVAHACLPGVALAFLITESTHPLILMTGAMCAGFIAIACIQYIKKLTSLKMDAIFGIILSVFFGFGLVCITIAQKYPIAHQSALNAVIFGNAATLFVSDIVIAACIAVFVVVCIILFWKELKLLAFDHAYAHTRGYTTDHLDNLLTFLIVVTIALGLHMVGVVLMSTMLVAPAATARLWTSHFGHFIVYSALFGACFSITGTLISSQFTHIPTGPVIAVVAITCVLISLILPSQRRSGRTL